MVSIQQKILTGGKSEFRKEEISLGEFFFKKSQEYGDKILQIDAASDQVETYSSINKKAVRLALHMKKWSIGSEHVVVSCLNNRMESTIPHLATIYLGAKICSLAPTQSKREYNYFLNLVKPKVIFSETDCAKLLEEASCDLPERPVIVVIGASEGYISFDDLQKKISGEEEFQPKGCENCHDTGMILFSSGSTGLSKAVKLSHYALLNGTKNVAEMDHFAPEIILSYASYYWISSVLLLTVIFHKGGCKIIPEPFEPKRFLQIIEKYKVPYVLVAFNMIHSILEVLPQVSYDLSSLYSITFTGGSIPSEKLKQVRSLMGLDRITVGYGMTEGEMSAILFDYTRERAGLNKFGSSGRCVKDTEIKIVDISTVELLGPNEKGELLIKSPYLSSGYYKADIPMPTDADGFLKTGDIAYYDEEGYIYIVDRIKEVFKYKLYNIFPNFLESILLEHPAVKEAAVFGIPNDEDSNWPAALVTLKENSSVTAKEIEEFFSENVSDQQKLRGGLKIISEFDKLPSGKIQKSLLREKFQSCT